MPLAITISTCLEPFEAVYAIVEDFYGGSERKGCPGGKLADDAGAEDNDLCRRNTRNATQQYSFSMIGRAEILSCDKHYGAAGDLAHAPDDRVGAAVILQVLKGNTCDPFVHHLLQQVGLHSGKMNRGDDDLVELQQWQVLLDDRSAFHQYRRLQDLGLVI